MKPEKVRGERRLLKALGMKPIYFAGLLAIVLGACAQSGAAKADLAAEQASVIAQTAELGDAAWLEARSLAQEAVANDESRKIEMAGIIGRSLVLGPDNETRASEAEAYLVAGLQEDKSLHWLLAKGYDNGWYGEVDKARGCEHYLAAATEATLNGAYWPTALCYLNGTGVEQNDQTAFEWMDKSANAGDQSGMVSLAVLYAKGQGTDKDLNMAATWYETAIRADGPNRAQALRGLGAMHLFELEDGVQQRGYALLELAKGEGDAVAARLLTRVSRLDEDQRIAVNVQKEFLTNFYKLAENEPKAG